MDNKLKHNNYGHELPVSEWTVAEKMTTLQYEYGFKIETISKMSEQKMTEIIEKLQEDAE